MVKPANGGRIPRQVLSVVNGGQETIPRAGPASIGGSDCGAVGFTREGVEALLNERIKDKNKLTFKQEKQGKMLESAEKRCNDMEMITSNKEEEMNLVIMELRKNCVALQEKFAKEESDKLAAMESLIKEKDARLSAERSRVSTLEELERAQREYYRNDTYKRLQEYNTSLQQYNSKLQSEVNQTNKILKNMEKEKVTVLENLSNLRGHCNSLQNQLTAAKASSNETMKLKEALASEMRDDRDRVLSQVQDLSAEVMKYKEWTGQSAAELGNLTKKSNELEATCYSQSNQIKNLQEKLAAAENKLEMSDLSAFEIRTGYEEQKRVNSELKFRLAEAEYRLVEGESLRKKLHNTILVCIFAYGQTGSGKTHTMMGTPGNLEEKGLIPRSLEQIFESRQTLQNQGWKYEMQVSMLEIYNETIHDLLTTNRPGSTELGAKQYTIKHDANGNTHVSDLTIIDVRSSREVSFLLNRAAQSRSVDKTHMTEQSSRSHFVFTLRITGVNESTEQQVQGVLNLIDLAGIYDIFDFDVELDQPCLGGDSKTLMVVNVSPASCSSNESLCSLRFAARVNACEIGMPRRQTSVKQFDARFSYG
ncbi:hypothetical protein R6Q59_015799 [Mikania micrantha]